MSSRLHGQAHQFLQRPGGSPTSSGDIRACRKSRTIADGGGLGLGRSRTMPRGPAGWIRSSRWAMAPTTSRCCVSPVWALRFARSRLCAGGADRGVEVVRQGDHGRGRGADRTQRGGGQSGGPRCGAGEVRPDVGGDVTEYIVGFYNNVRLHSTIGYLTPTAYERTKAAVKPIGVSEIS